MRSPEVSHHSSDDRDDSCVIAVLPLWILWLSIVSGCDGSDGYSYIVIAVVMISMTMVVNTILMWMSLMIVLRCAPEEIPWTDACAIAMIDRGFAVKLELFWTISSEVPKHRENKTSCKWQWLVGGLEHEFYFSIQLGISSSQLTNSIIFFRGVGIPPTSDMLSQPVIFFWGKSNKNGPFSIAM